MDIERRREEERRPVEEAGGGVAEGFEQAEEALRDAAEHGDGGGDPIADRGMPEPESAAAGAVYGEPDQVESTEVVDESGADATHSDRVTDQVPDPDPREPQGG